MKEQIQGDFLALFIRLPLGIDLWEKGNVGHKLPIIGVTLIRFHLSLNVDFSSFLIKEFILYY